MPRSIEFSAQMPLAGVLQCFARRLAAVTAVQSSRIAFHANNDHCRRVLNVAGITREAGPRFFRGDLPHLGGKFLSGGFATNAAVLRLSMPCVLWLPSVPQLAAPLPFPVQVKFSSREEDLNRLKKQSQADPYPLFIGYCRHSDGISTF